MQKKKSMTSSKGRFLSMSRHLYGALYEIIYKISMREKKVLISCSCSGLMYEKS